jgi:hypothetical protein
MVSLAIAAATLATGLQFESASAQASRVPARLTDAEFWRLSSSMSEPSGYFRSENLVSNEHTFQDVIPALRRRVAAGGVYLGVAPDQNFTYIVATRPRIAFIVDIRRGNLLQHLMYKAIVQLSADRAGFLSRLFSKPRPPGLGASTTAAGLCEAFGRVAASDTLYHENVHAIRAELVERHGFPLSADDLDQIESIYFAFFWYGPGLKYSNLAGSGRGFSSTFPTYQDLMVQSNRDGEPQSYLANEAAFRALKSMQEKNLIVPVVGNFAGPKALRSVGRYVRERGAVVNTFYVSNVEQYLFQDGLFEEFAENVAALPLDESSTFVRSVSRRFGYGGDVLGPDGRASALDPMREFVVDYRAGRIRNYYDVNARSR